MKVSRETPRSIEFTPIIMETEVLQAGDIGGTGVSKFRWCTTETSIATQAQVKAFADALHAFYGSWTQFLPANMSHAVQVDTKVLDVPSGQMLGMVEYPGTLAAQPGTVSGGNYPAGTGMRLEWMTEGVIAGRLLRGATFLVPLAGNVWTSAGALNSVIQNSLIGDAVNLLNTTVAAGVHLGVYHRPKKGQTSGGIWFETTAVRLGTTPAGLRSRRVLE